MPEKAEEPKAPRVPELSNQKAGSLIQEIGTNQLNRRK